MERTARLNKVKLGIRAKLVGLLLPTIVIVLTAILLIVYSNTSNMLLQKSESLLQSNSTGVVNSVSAWMNEVLSTLETQRDTIQYFKMPESQELDYIKHTAGQNEAYPAGVYIATTNGQLKHASFVPAADYDLFSKPWYIDGLKSEKMTFGEVYFDSDSQKSVVGVSGMLKSSSGGVRGVVAADIYLDAISQIVRPVQIEQTGGMFLVDTLTDIIIGHKDAAMAGVLLSEQQDAMYQGISKLVAAGASGLQSAKAADGSEIYLNLQSVPNSKWVAVAYVPRGEVLSDLNRLSQMIASLAVAAILILFLLVFLLVRRTILRPVREIDSVARRIAEGKLDETIHYQSGDEFGQLAGNFNQTVSRLRDYVNYIDEISKVLNEISDGNLQFELSYAYEGEFAKVKDALLGISQSFNRTLAQINQSADQVSAGSDQVSAGAQALSQGATEQAASVQELAATISEISHHVKENAESAGEASRKAVHTGEQIDQSNQRMRDLTDAMAEISSASGEIGKIIKVIEDIAFQTNILALNAAVEAARAGAAGKGFAVVADEVRNLAGKSAEASKSTAALIEGSIRSVENGAQIARETAQSLMKAVEGARSVVETVSRISHASNDQATAIAQVTQGVEQISGVVQTNSATAQQSAAASEELSAQAQTLKNLVGGFRLKGDSGFAALEFEEEPPAAPAHNVRSYSPDKY